LSLVKEIIYYTLSKFHIK